MTPRERRAAAKRAAPPAVVRVVIYVRISMDRSGEALGVERQEADCRALAALLGWVVVAVYADNDIGASTRSRKPRPAYAEMLRAVKAGQADAIMAYSNSRLTRRPAEWLELIELANTRGVRIKTVVSGEQDLSTEDGKAVAMTIAIWDAAEAGRTGERTSRAMQQKAEAGQYRGGPRPFGFEADGITLREAEAAVIRERSKQVLAGRSLRSMARELNEAGSMTSTGKPWTPSLLRDMLIRPRNAGLVSTGRRDEMEIVGKAQWPAVVDEDTWRAVHALLTNPDRSHPNLTNEDRWLSVYSCGWEGCGAAMRPSSTLRKGGGNRFYYYRCTDTAHVTIAAVRTDEHVRRAVAELVRDPRIIAAFTEGKGSEALAADRERRAVLAVRLEAFGDDYAAGVITGRVLAKSTAKVVAEIEVIDARMASGLQRSAADGVLRAPDPGAAFLKAPLDVQRAVLRTVATVTIRPVARKGEKWSEARVKIGPAASG